MKIYESHNGWKEDMQPAIRLLHKDMNKKEAEITELIRAIAYVSPFDCAIIYTSSKEVFESVVLDKSEQSANILILRGYLKKVNAELQYCEAEKNPSVERLERFEKASSNKVLQ